MLKTVYERAGFMLLCGDSFGFLTSSKCTTQVDEGIRAGVAGLLVQGLAMHYLSSSVHVFDRPPLGDLGLPAFAAHCSCHRNNLREVL